MLFHLISVSGEYPNRTPKENSETLLLQPTKSSELIERTQYWPISHKYSGIILRGV
jgi:hypothetical protein